MTAEAQDSMREMTKDCISLDLPDKFPAKIPAIHSPTTSVASTGHNIIIAFLLFSNQGQNVRYITFYTAAENGWWIGFVIETCNIDLLQKVTVTISDTCLISLLLNVISF